VVAIYIILKLANLEKLELYLCNNWEHCWDLPN